jgi:hypothetical protein
LDSAADLEVTRLGRKQVSMIRVPVLSGSELLAPAEALLFGGGLLLTLSIEVY